MVTLQGQFKTERLGFILIDKDGNEIDLTDKDKYFIKNIQGLDHPTLRMVDGQIAGFDGSFLGNQFYNGRLVSLDGDFRFQGFKKRNTNDQIYATRQEFLDKITRFQNPITLKIIELLTTGIKVLYKVEGRLDSFDSPTGNKKASSWPFSINIKTEFPFIQSYEQESLILNQSFIVSGDRIPDRIGDRIGTVTSSVNNAEVNGNIISYPILKVTGKVVDFISVSNASSGETLRLDFDQNSGEDVVVDNWKKTVIRNSSINAISIKSGDWLTLNKGDNFILYNFGAGSNATATLLWNDNFTGL